MGTPSLAISHGGHARSVLGRLDLFARNARWPVYTVTADAFLIADAEAVIAGVGQGGSLLVFHLLELRESETSKDVEQIVAAIDALDSTISDAYPGIDLHAWAIVLTGRTIDDVEATLLSELSDRVRGVIATTASTNATVAHSQEDEIAFAADLAAFLGNSPLELALVDRRGIWFAAASSATFHAEQLRTEIASSWMHVASLSLIAERDTANDHNLGELWAKSLLLSDSGGPRRLLDDPLGGSLLARVRLSDIEFDNTPVEAWSDAIVTRYDLITMVDLPVIHDRIAASGEREFEERKLSIARQIFVVLTETTSIPAAVAHCAGIRLQIEKDLDKVRAQEPDHRSANTTGADRVRLRELLKWLPLGPAVAIRVLMVALFALALLAALASSETVPVDVLASPWPAVISVGIVIAGTGFYRVRLRRTVRVRDRLRRGLEDYLEADVVGAAHDAYVELLEKLLAWIGEGETDEIVALDSQDDDGAESTLSGWLQFLEAEVRSAVPALDPASSDSLYPDSGATPYAINVPTIETLANIAPATLDAPSEDRVIHGFLDAIRSHLVAAELTHPDIDALFGAWTEDLRTEPRFEWETIEMALRSDPASANSVRDVIRTDLTPTGTGDAPVYHYLLVPGGESGSLAGTLLPGDEHTASGVLVSLTATWECAAGTFLGLVSIYLMDSVTPESST